MFGTDFEFRNGRPGWLVCGNAGATYGVSCMTGPNLFQSTRTRPVLGSHRFCPFYHTMAAKALFCLLFPDTPWPGVQVGQPTVVKEVGSLNNRVSSERDTDLAWRVRINGVVICYDSHFAFRIQDCWQQMTIGCIRAKDMFNK